MRLLTQKTFTTTLPLLHRPSLRLHLSSSSFQPPPPPTSNGTPIYPDIQHSTPTPQSLQRNSDPNAIFLVTGANRGIGLQYVKSLSQRVRGRVVACCRNPTTAHALSAISDANDAVEILPLDVTDEDQIAALGTEMTGRYGRVDALFNVAGVLGDGTTTPGPERSLARLDAEWMRRSMEVNCIGPALLARELAPLMTTTVAARRGRGESSSTTRAPSVIVNVSARVGSISDNNLGGWYSYRCSKAALNQYTRTLSHELKRKGVWVLALHPGTTDTDLSRPFQKNVKEGRLFPVEFTVGRLLDVVDGMEEGHCGGFFDWDGRALPF
eukprot:CAMPEP_0172497498 /NCGR_PEP_ID=MMETSP1066-20121228/100839_1 /TAXON_ID=671091 /ORGANISM="Coscinodiscus wailesii, Strain CCMP2513" /LENGTH=324 /DNA_ID=CAMNT_0013270313 /DNA_START=125 /DNA_END=1102 /DNA_ORIENTATION=-